MLPPERGTASLSDAAYLRIRDLIVSLELAPGSIVNERELMERLALGRTPVREALRALAQEGLVDVYPRRGIFVSTVDAGDLASLSEVRRELESYAARVAAERASDIERQEAAALGKELARTKGPRQLIDQHNPFLEKTLNEYYVLTLRIWFLVLDRVARLDDAVQEHRELMDAIRAGDADRAEATMSRHVLGFERAIREVL